MNEENEKYLYETYPQLYWQHNLPMSQTAMCWGFDVGDGWFLLIDLLSRALLPYVDEVNKKEEEWFNQQDEETKQMMVEPSKFGVVQVKQKFAGLRYYVSHSTKEISDIIDLFERLSYSTCEVCGKIGKPRRGGWIETLCDEHAGEKEALEEEWD